jgi:hypothetical protein
MNSRVLGGGSALDEFVCLVGLKFLEDCFAPKRPVDALDGQREKEVAL